MEKLRLTNATFIAFCILLVAVLFTNCSDPFQTPPNKFEQLTPPIVLVAKSKEGAITVCDSKNQYVTIGQEWFIANTIYNSYEKGDTLLFLNGN